ncbi:MAG: hypothetical protein NTY02_09295, partial [Acidobacteria bacterium]|nr:hypothetical protein [Acidobacteriota bacterium]
LLEAGVRLARGRAIGYLAGGAVAVSWSMVQRILNAMISFGTDVVRLYVDAYQFAAKSLGVPSFGPFDLIATLIALECVAGVAAAATGLRIGRSASLAAAGPQAAGTAEPLFPGPPIVAEGTWSLARLAAVSVTLVGGMLALGWLPLWLAALLVAVFAAFVLRTYPRAVKRIQRLSLWLELAAVMLFAGLVFGGVSHGLSGMVDGLAAGAAMVLRATMVLFGFTAVSVELRNPSILAFVERRKLRGLSDALGVAFGILPAFTASLSSGRQPWRQPGRVILDLLQLANGLVLADGRATRCRAVVLLSGSTGSGKTTLTQAAIGRLRQAGVRVGGILAPGLLESGRRTGFDIVNLATGEHTVLAREQQNVAGRHARWSRFAFAPEGLALGHRALGDGIGEADVVIVDEVGPFELSGGGWADALDTLTRTFRGALLLVVRDSVVDAVRARWGTPDTVVCDVDRDSAERIAGLLDGRAMPPAAR